MPNLKDLYQLKKQAGEMQKQLAEETIQAESNGCQITMNGNQKVLSVTLNEGLSKQDQEQHIQNTINDCLKKVKELMAKTMMSMQ